jgi:two-component system, chemotaxis family, sensor kinase CheA
LSTLEDQLNQITAALDDMRAHPTSGPDTRKALDSLFRQTHSLKAAAAVDGLNELSRAAHELENILHSLRTGNITLNDQALQQLTEKSREISESLPLIHAEIWKSLKTEEKHTLAQAIKEGAEIFLVQTNFDVADFDQRFQSLKKFLTSSGELISIAPKAKANRINFRIIYARAATLSDVSREVSVLSDVAVEELRRREKISFAQVVQRALRAGQTAAAALRKTIDFEVRGEALQLKESLCNAIADPLIHLVRNAVGHGIEHEGKVTIEAVQTSAEVKITVTDDGRGIDPETLGKLFQPGFSTASEISELSGRGVGLDVVKTAIEEAGGSVKVVSQPGEGSTFELTLPLISV